MTTSSVSQTSAEQPVPGDVPRLEVPGWRDRYGVVAGITSRGSGDPGFDLGLNGAQPVGEVMERWRRFRGTFPQFRGFISAQQVHGTQVCWYQGHTGWFIVDETDGHATGEPGVLLTVSVADCIPVYIVDPVRRAVALLHAGWRGTAGRILHQGVAVLERLAGVSVENLVIHIGAGICGRCYEVGSEVFAACARSSPANGSGPLDLRALLRDQACGLGVQTVSTSPHCSAHDRNLFFSHRRSQGREGRMAAYLGLVP